MLLIIESTDPKNMLRFAFSIEYKCKDSQSIGIVLFVYNFTYISDCMKLVHTKN